jgi:hypothetical protein
MKRLRRKRTGWKRPVIKVKLNVSVVRGTGCNQQDPPPTGFCSTLQVS